MRYWTATLFFASLLFVGARVFAQGEVDAARIRSVVQALNSQPQEWLEPITEADVHLQNGIGRADVNKKAKFSYYIHTENPSDPRSPITLIPMATSRYTPTYYQTDEWWDAHKEEIEKARREGLPMPRQDMGEVEVWLKQMKLSTNPLVFRIESDGRVQTTRLQDFLLNYYLKNYAKNGKITLFRGGEKPTETGEWLAGRKPRGVRYWTPTATYGWRYARKNPTFLEDLVNGRAPLYVFEISVEAFREMVQARWQKLTLGTELTKRAHDNFDRSGRFIDHLLGQTDYMGIGDIGVEFEIRSNSEGASRMVQYFKRPIGIEELIQDRLTLLEKAEARLLKARPQETATLRSQFEARRKQTLTEGKILLALQLEMSRETVQALLSELRSAPYEIANVDSVDFRSFAQQKLASLESKPLESTKERADLDRRLGTRGLLCRGLFN
jgi:hypothetical protein